MEPLIRRLIITVTPEFHKKFKRWREDHGYKSNEQLLRIILTKFMKNPAKYLEV